MTKNFRKLIPAIEEAAKSVPRESSTRSDSLFGEGDELDLFYYPLELMFTSNEAENHLEALKSESAFRAFSNYQEEFEAFMTDLGMRHFKASEFLYLGGGHYAPGGCNGLNGVPSKSKWNKIRQTAAVLDEIRERLGAPVLLNSIYRNYQYNKCIGGVSGSLHKEFNAVDFRCLDNHTSGHWAQVAKDVRNEGMFKGGIGIYNTFVHMDTRGVNADWDKR